MARRPPTLFRFISIAIAGVAVLPILGVSVIVGGAATARIEADVAIRYQRLADRVAERLDEGLHERLSDVRSLAAVIGADFSPDGLRRVRTALDTIRDSTPQYDWIGLTDATGRVLVSTEGMLEGQDVSSRPWFRGGLQGRFVGDVHDAVLLSKLLGPAPDGTPRRFVDVAVPVSRPDGVPVGVLGGHLSWSWAEEVERSVLGAITNGGTGADALVLSKEGLVLMGPADLLGRMVPLPSVQAAAQGSRRSGVETWPDGNAYMTAVTPSRGFGDNPGLGWIIVVRQDPGIAFAAAKSIRWQLAGVGFLAALSAFVVGLLLTRRVAQPLSRLAAAAESLRRGDLTTRVPYTRAYAEVATISAALVDLETRIAESQCPDIDVTVAEGCTEGPVI